MRDWINIVNGVLAISHNASFTSTNNTPESDTAALLPLVKLPKVDSKVVVLQVCDKSCSAALTCRKQ